MNLNVKAKNKVDMMGNFLQDLASTNELGVFFKTPNAVEIVKDSSYFITNRFSGNGAVHEVCDLIIRSNGSKPSLEFKRYIKKR